MRQFRIIYNDISLKYKIQKRFLWGLIWYDVEKPGDVDIQGFEYSSYTIYFNSMKEAEDYIQTHFAKGKEFIIKTVVLK